MNTPLGKHVRNCVSLSLSESVDCQETLSDIGTLTKADPSALASEEPMCDSVLTVLVSATHMPGEAVTLSWSATEMNQTYLPRHLRGRGGSPLWKVIFPPRRVDQSWVFCDDYSPSGRRHSLHPLRQLRPRSPGQRPYAIVARLAADEL